jgi:hypothetical protein
MKQIAMNELMFRDHYNKPSANFAELAEKMELPDLLFRSPLDKDQADSYILLPTDNSIGASKPIMVEDPENYDYTGTNVVFADLSARFINGQTGVDYYNLVKDLREIAAKEKRVITNDDMKNIGDIIDSEW